MTFAPHRPKPLVYIETKNKYYARYIGWRQRSGCFIAQREMDHYEIETFRTNPEAFVRPEDLDPMWPVQA